MTFLPIVGRELRVAARRRGIYRVRLAAPLVALLAGVVILIGNLGASANLVGKEIFWGLSILCFIYCLSAGRFATADSLSAEKREGTLGLLFLTDLKGYDVVLGKLAATSVSSFYGLLAVLPVLAIPLLMGGITNAELWRVVLALVNTFLFSLAIGIFTSALSRDGRRAMGANFGLLVLLTGGVCGVAAIWAGLGHKITEPILLTPSPIFQFGCAFDNNYKRDALYYWWSAGIVHGLTWLMLVAASWLLPRSWQEQPLVATTKRRRRIVWREVWRVVSYGKASKRGPHRKRLLDVNAFYWLAAKERLKPLHVWTFLALISVWWTGCWVATAIEWSDPIITVTGAVLLNTVFKLWITLEAGQQLAEDQKGGAMELLLSTPLTAGDIVRGQLLALRRQFLKPLLLVLAVEVVFMLGGMRNSPTQEKRSLMWIWGAGMLMMAVDVAALIFVSMRTALTAKSPTRAVLNTVVKVLVLPWLGFGLVTWLAVFWENLLGGGWEPGWKFCLPLWLGLGLVADLFFGLRAWRDLRRNFRPLATWRFAPEPRGNWWQRWRQRRQDRPWWTRRRAMAFGTMAGLVVASYFYFSQSKPDYPPPVLVTLSRSNAPLQVSPGTSIFLVLPDGSLWRWGGNPSGYFPRLVSPERVGTNDDWLQVHGFGDRCVGVRRDGTLWAWGRMTQRGTTNRVVVTVQEQPTQLEKDSDWTRVFAGGGFYMALKRDGTLWARGDNSRGQLGTGTGAGKVSTNFVQVGTDHDWVEVAPWRNTATMAMKSDGSLWLWGQGYTASLSASWSMMGPIPVFLPTPTQICRETNWVSLEPGQCAWTSSGELWSPWTTGTPNAGTSVAVTGEFMGDNSAPGRLVVAWTGAFQLYEIRTNGTLWTREFVSGVSPGMAVNWLRVGRRTDWVRLWNAGNTVLGLTADGTLWTWGVDPGRDATATVGGKFRVLREKFSYLFSTATGRSQKVPTYWPSAAVQEEPRPLMKFISPETPAK